MNKKEIFWGIGLIRANIEVMIPELAKIGKIQDFESLAFRRSTLKFQIKLYLNYQLSIIIKYESSKASSISEPANEANLSVNHAKNDTMVDPRAFEGKKNIKNRTPL